MSPASRFRCPAASGSEDPFPVIPAKAGISLLFLLRLPEHGKGREIPAFAGMTRWGELPKARPTAAR
ncbi:hypothetical protein EIK56_26770 [Sphingomonas sp. C8-2]|nr:hypothetical protein EIK56_26770 [Sphingomonas sp. C8-2]